MEKPDFNISLLLDYMKKENVTPEDIKSQIIDEFKPYFRNYGNLEKYSTRFLISEWINYSKLRHDNSYIVNIQRIIEIFNYLKDNNPSKVFELVVDWSDEINKSDNSFWSFKNLEVSKKNLDLDDFAAECLKNIGQYLEGLIKPYLKCYFHIFSEYSRKNYTYENVYKRDLGNVVDYLITKNELINLLFIQPSNVRISQWRNIAYHHKSEIVGGKIRCKYKKQDTEEIIELTKDELFNVAFKTRDIYICFKTAFTLFFIDNINDIRQKYIESNKVYQPRNQILDLDFFSTINAQGFEIASIDIDDNSSKMILNDNITNSFGLERAIHSSQFLYNLWIYSQKEFLTIEYRVNDEPYFEAKLNSKICEEAQKSGQILKYLADRTYFKLIKENIEIKSH